jgi:hypothetical protein
MTQTIPEQDLPPFAVSRRTAAKLYDCSIDHIDDLVDRGLLELIPLGKRRRAVTWRSLQKLIDREAS